MSGRFPTAWVGLVLVGWLVSTSLSAEEDTPSGEDVYELQKLLVDTLDQVERNYVKEVSRRQLVEAAIRGILSELDPHSAYISREEMEDFRETVESQFGGIGIRVTLDNGRLTVLSPIVGTPAYRAGILAGDRIIAINGKSTKGISMEEAERALEGESDTQVTLTVTHPGSSKTEEITITRAVVRVETVLGDHRNDDDTWNFLVDEEHAIAYVWITAFSRNTAAELRQALAEIDRAGARGLILDLRFNPGGLLRSAIEASDLFVSDGRIVSTKGRSTKEHVWNATKRGTSGDLTMVVLVNRYSASASEIVAACLQDHDRAVIMGERTWGKGSVQNVIELEDGQSALKLTTSSYRRPDGRSIHRFPNAGEDDPWGVIPNDGYQLKLTDKEIEAVWRAQKLRKLLRPKPSSQEAPTSDRPDDDKPSPPPEDVAGEQDPDAPAEAPPEPEFIDPQLRMAVDYLCDELARAETRPQAESDLGP